MQPQGDNAPTADHFTDKQVATMLGVNPVTVRKWRVKNKKAGCIKYGPPYEHRNNDVVYPVQAFREWCAQVRVVNGVPHLNLPVSADVSLRAVFNEIEHLRAQQ